MTDKLNVEELTESLTGFEEIAISKAFSVREFSELPGTMSMRALLFVAFKREGDDDAKAYERTMEMSLKACNDTFDHEIEAIPNQPVTESGKGSEPPEGEPMSSPSGASPQVSPLISSMS